jgi:hypothetical protein
MTIELLSDSDRAKFLERLLDGTSKQKIRWEKGRDEYVFSTTIGRFLYVITSDDRDDVAPYTFHIYSKPASQDERPSVIATWDWDRNGYADSNSPMQALYLTVKRTTLGLDQIVNHMLADLAQVDGGPAALGPSVPDPSNSDW